MELGGTAPGSGYDQLQSSGALAFDGTLQVSLINGFIPAAGQSFNLFDWSTTSGTFDTLQLPTLAGLSWNTSQLYTTGTLKVGNAGDFGVDGPPGSPRSAPSLPLHRPRRCRGGASSWSEWP